MSDSWNLDIVVDFLIFWKFVMVFFNRTSSHNVFKQSKGIVNQNTNCFQPDEAHPKSIYFLSQSENLGSLQRSSDEGLSGCTGLTGFFGSICSISTSKLSCIASKL